MAMCIVCGKKGFFLRVNQEKMCTQCVIVPFSTVGNKQRGAKPDKLMVFTS